MSMFSIHYVIGKRFEGEVVYWTGLTLRSFAPGGGIRFFARGDAETVMRNLLSINGNLEIFEDE